MAARIWRFSERANSGKRRHHRHLAPSPKRSSTSVLSKGINTSACESYKAPSTTPLKVSTETRSVAEAADVAAAALTVGVEFNCGLNYRRKVFQPRLRECTNCI